MAWSGEGETYKKMICVLFKAEKTKFTKNVGNVLNKGKITRILPNITHTKDV